MNIYLKTVIVTLNILCGSYLGDRTAQVKIGIGNLKGSLGVISLLCSII